MTSDADLQRSLLNWYMTNSRDLPWRRDPSAYHTVVSELMLQQTQVDRVIPAYEAFILRFPTFAALAAAARSDVVRAWRGLGYNRRAVHLHELARAVVDRHEGQLPDSRKDLLALPGVGPYTAGAILSLAFGQDEAAMDTNVRRVIGRYRGDDRPAQVAQEAGRLVPSGRASEWNQALMDLGATICVSRRPRCLVCPIADGCASAGRVEPRGQTTARVMPFESTMRYYRGRFLDELRALPAGSGAPLAELASRLKACGVAGAGEGWACAAR
jgi:A/G-specific adenine glycosylase